jgi:SAM-dependent methyltransferase
VHVTAGVAAGAAPRASNRLQAQDQAVHNWYRFVLSFPPHLVRDYLERFRVRSTESVLDPFCGTGTTLVECKKLGIPSVGVEPNPVACFASQVKIDWDVDPDALLNHAQRVADLALKRLRAQGIEDETHLPLFARRPTPDHRLRVLPDDGSKLLLRNSISPLPLHKVLELLEVLQGEADLRFLRHERLALAKALVFRISNLEFGPEVGVGPAKSDAPVVVWWLDGVREMVRDLRGVQGGRGTSAVVHCADSRDLTAALSPRSVDAVITSPPYPNEKDYTRTTRLESVLLGFIRSKEDLRALKRALVRSNTRAVYKGDDDDLAVAGNRRIGRIAAAIERRRVRLGKNSGFERLYPRVTKLYFGGMARHLANLRGLLRPGARLAYVVGDQASYLRVMIRTGRILADMAESLGYEVVGIDLFRKRLATATREQLREEVVLLRWPGARAERRASS